MGVNSLPETVKRQRRDCDLNPGPSAPESSTLTTRLPSHPTTTTARALGHSLLNWLDSNRFLLFGEPPTTTDSRVAAAAAAAAARLLVYARR